MISLENSYLTVKIDSQGAELKSVVSKQTELEYMWSGNPEYWGRVSPVLFPIVGRLADDKYFHEEKEYSMGQHGIARDLPFEVVSETETYVRFELNSNDRTKENYPFDFTLAITYELTDTRVDVLWEVVNPNDNEVLPFSIGAHPAFSTQIFDALNIEDYYFDFPVEEKLQSWDLNKNGNYIDSYTDFGESDGLRLSPEIFKNDALVFKGLQSKRLTLRNMKNDRAVTMDLENFTFNDEEMILGIWTPYADGSVAPFVCIEPWFGHADKESGPFEINEKSGIIKLGSKNEFKAGYGLIFE